MSYSSTRQTPLNIYSFEREEGLLLLLLESTAASTIVYTTYIPRTRKIVGLVDSGCCCNIAKPTTPATVKKIRSIVPALFARINACGMGLVNDLLTIP